MEPMGLKHQAQQVFARMQEEVKHLNQSKGWYDTRRTFAEDVALLHSEVSEALEEYRRHGTEDRTVQPTASANVNERLHPPRPLGVPSELADVLIRLLDTCERYEIDLVKAFDEKMKYNWNRPYRHGDRRV